MNTKSANHAGVEKARRPSLAINQLVDRYAQLEAFREVIQRVEQRRHVANNIFEWYGSPGIGKSALITLLTDACRKYPVAYAVINFKSALVQQDDFLREPLLLVDQVLSSWNRETTTLIPTEYDAKVAEYRVESSPEGGVIQAYTHLSQDDRLYNRPAWLEKMRLAIYAFLIQIKKLQDQPGDGTPLVLMFDETESAPTELVDWLEEWLVTPLSQLKSCVIVWTARRPWRWRRPEIRQRLSSQPLSAFDPEQVKEQIERSGRLQVNLSAQLFKNVHVLTGGHPLASRIAVDEIDVLLGQGKNVTPETFSEYEAFLLAEIFEKFIDKYVLKELKTKHLRVACKLMSLVRYFDTTMLREVLKVGGEPEFQNWSQEKFGELLLDLKKTQLLTWEKGYAIDHDLRHIIRRHYLISDKKAFEQVNRKAIEVYATWLNRPIDNRGLIILEEMYHYASLMEIGDDINLTEIIRARLEGFATWIKDDREALISAIDRLDGEIRFDKDFIRMHQISTILQKEISDFREKIPQS